MVKVLEAYLHLCMLKCFLICNLDSLLHIVGEVSCFTSQMSHESTINRSDQRFFIKIRPCEFQPKMADNSAKHEVSENLVHLLRHAYFMPKGFDDIQILSQGNVLSDVSGLPEERNPFLKALFCDIDFNYSTFHSLILLSSKCNLHLKQHKRLDKGSTITLYCLQSNTN